MEELSIEDKAKRYDEAIEKAEKWHNAPNVDKIPTFGNRIIEDIFPELKESEDERIREWIIDDIRYNINNERLNNSEYKKKAEKAIAWLEKQKDANEEYWRGYREGKQEILDKYAELEQQEEQSLNIIWHDASEEPEARGEIFCEWKSSTDTWHSIVFYLPNSKTFCEGERIVKNVLRWTYVDEMLEKQGEYKFADKPNKVDPIFHEGDWIVFKSTGTVYQIRNCIELIHTHKYGYYLTDGAYISSDIVNQYRLWTIQDAREGDMLCTYECDEPKIIFILKGTPKKHRALRYRCYYNIMYPYFESDSETGCLAPNEEDVKPATKEQRDLLFQKMKESGYEWDAVKKQLIKL